MGFWNNTNKKHGEPFIDRVDKNGTEHWVDHNCPKCGGTGYLPGYEFIDGARCWKCGATGYHPHKWTVHTPEYAAKLAAKRDAKRTKENLAARPAFLKDNGFSVEGVTYAITGKTFDIKDELKAAGARYCAQLGWHFSEKPENFPFVEMTVVDCFWENAVASLNWNDTCDLQALIKERTPKEPSDEPTSEHIGAVGERISFEVKSITCLTSFETMYGTSYLYKLTDTKDNIYIWKTSKRLSESVDVQTIVGTVKDHGEYNGEKQTELTRCKTIAVA